MPGTIRVLTARELPASAAKSPLRDPEAKSLLPNRKLDPVISDVEIDKLKLNLGKLSQSVGELFDSAESTAGYKLKSIEVGVEITAEGGVTLIGTLTVGGKAALTLTFEKS